jgi:DNA-binding MarR family transcriptional regulator
MGDIANKDKIEKYRPLKQLSTTIGRIYYLFLYFLDRELTNAGLEKHIRPGMGPVLYTLFENDNLIIKEIAQNTMLKYSTLTGTLEKMERIGLITRNRSKKDGRAIRIKLTEQGCSLKPELLKFSKHINTVIKKHLTEEDVVRLMDSLNKVMLAMKNNNNS